MSATLLLIDDDVSLCETVRFMLTKKGYQVEVAHNAISGLQKAYSIKPDIVILDVMLPDMDGWQTCRRFREMSDVPIIMLTALGSEEDVVEGLNLVCPHPRLAAACVPVEHQWRQWPRADPHL
jgi:DNA-binding response OmpR family regulator